MVKSESSNSLGGVWQYRQPADNISISSSDNLDDDENSFTTFTESESGVSTPLPSSDLSFFDPLSDMPPGNESDVQLSNAWLLSAMVACAELEKQGNQERRETEMARAESLHFPKAFSEYDDLEPPKTEANSALNSADSGQKQNSFASGTQSAFLSIAKPDSRMGYSHVPSPSKLHRESSPVSLAVQSPQRGVGSRHSTPRKTPSSPAPPPLLSPEILDINGKGVFQLSSKHYTLIS